MLSAKGLGGHVEMKKAGLSWGPGGNPRLAGEERLFTVRVQTGSGHGMCGLCLGDPMLARTRVRRLLPLLVPERNRVR